MSLIIIERGGMQQDMKLEAGIALGAPEFNDPRALRYNPTETNLIRRFKISSVAELNLRAEFHVL